jgi:ribbon-helix-helix protein, copG family
MKKDTNLNILISSELKNRLVEDAAKQGLPVSLIVRKLIEQYLNRKESIQIIEVKNES